MSMDPLVRFRVWLDDAIARSGARHPRAFCLSTTGADGAPDARFVDLKEVTDAGLVFGTHLQSTKAQAIARDARVAATFWWEEAGRQVRVSGRCVRLPDVASDRLFGERPRDAQLVATISMQSQPIDDPAALETQLQRVKDRTSEGDVVRPPAWGAYCIEPVRFEFLEFAPSRLHRRQLFVLDGDAWRSSWLQP